MIGRGAVDAHHSKERVQEALGLAQRQVEDETERERGFDREGGVLELPSTRADAARRPGVEGLRCQPQGDVAPADEGAIVGGPVRNAVLCLVRWMDSRLHPLSVVVGSIPSSSSSGSRSSNLSGREGFMHQRPLMVGIGYPEGASTVTGLARAACPSDISAPSLNVRGAFPAHFLPLRKTHCGTWVPTPLRAIEEGCKVLEDIGLLGRKAPPGDLIDAGTGDGRLPAFLAQRDSHREIHGIELDPYYSRWPRRISKRWRRRA